MTITQNVPEYQVNVGVGSADGFLDADHQDIKTKVEGTFIIQDTPHITSTLTESTKSNPSSPKCLMENSLDKITLEIVLFENEFLSFNHK